MENELLEQIRRLTERLDRLESENAMLRRELERKDRIIEGLQKRLFGSTSEKLDPAQLDLHFDEGEPLLGKPGPLPASGETSAPGEQNSNAAKTRRTKAERFPQNLMVVIDKVLIPDEVATNPQAWKEIGEEHHDELDITRSRMFWRRTVRKKFVHKSERHRPPVIVPAPLPSIPGTLCSPALAALILTDKYEDHLPHYRQSQRFRRRCDVDIGRQTLNTWHHAAARHLAPIGAAIKAELLHTSELQIDETPIDYLDPGHGKTRTGYLWVYHAPQTRVTWFDWQPGRGHQSMLEILGHDPATGTLAFRGTILCDGWSAYQALVARYGGIRFAGCLAHIRREFIEALPHFPEECGIILRAIAHIYHIETLIAHTKEHTACRELIRRGIIRPVADQLHRAMLAMRTRHLPHTRLGEAITYAMGEWPKFQRCLENGRLPLDNNEVENRIRPAKLGMKNWLFNGSFQAGANNALIHTLLTNCRTHGLDPEDYLTAVLTRLPHNATAGQAAALTPARLAGELKTARKSA